MPLVLDKENITAIVALGQVAPPPTGIIQIAEREGLHLKTEQHITVIGSVTGKVICSELCGQASLTKSECIRAVEEIAFEFRWSFSLQEKYYLISKVYQPSENGLREERRSIIQLVTLPDLAPFYAKLNRLLASHFDLPFPHITWFTTSTTEYKRLRGIGIYSKAQFYTMHPREISL
jgi:hypothetical protein